MQTELRVAAIQLNSGLSREENLAIAGELLAEAAGQGARLAVLPELFNRLGDLPAVAAGAEPIPGPTSNWLADQAKKWNLMLCGGSICEQSPQQGRGYNTSLLISPEGKLLAGYRKIHLFNVDIPGQVTVRESDFMLPGEQVVATSTPLGCLGQATCYDLRFPEQFRRLADAGAELLLIPAAFTRVTGRDHWITLLRARAIENQAFVVAANQCGRHGPKLESFGHSAILDPWGEVLSEASEDRPEVIFADLRASRLAEVRTRLPALKNRRL